MVENCFSVALFCICACVLSIALRQYCREQSLLLSLGTCIIVLGGVIAFIYPIIGDIREIFEDSGISDAYISLIFKATAVCFITQITCEICRDSGELAIASAQEIWGRAAITFISLPVLKALLELVQEII